MEHLLLYCGKAQIFMGFHFLIFGKTYVLAGSIKENIVAWHRKGVRKKRTKVLKTAHLPILDSVEADKLNCI